MDRDIYLLDFYERKSLQPLLIGNKELLQLATNHNYKWILEKDIFSTIKNRYTLLCEILTFCKGKVSLCGKSVVELMRQECYVGQTFRLCFYSCEEDYLQNNIGNINSRVVINYNNQLIISVGSWFINLSNLVYKNKEEMVRNSYVKHFYNLEDGYFTTINGGLSLVMETFPLDMGIATITKYAKVVDKTRFRIFLDKGYVKLNTKNNGSIVIGISNECHLTFSRIKDLYNINDDMFKLLCYHWFLAEVDDAKHRLLK